MRESPSISVAVCTHNGAARLADCLASLRDQRCDAPFEVLVILNACSDESADIAKRFAFRIVSESQLGLSHARNRALAEARAPVVAFIDDDAVAEPDWLAALLAVWDAEPDAGCVGGRIHLKWEAPKPDWWTNRLDEVFGYFDYPQSRMQMHHPRYPYGGNISYRRDAALAVGGFNPALGRIGRKLVAGEEGELCYKLERAGRKIFYDRGPLVHHAARPDRASPLFILRRAIMHGRSQRIIETHHRMTATGVPQWGELVKAMFGSALRGRLDLVELKWLTYRFGYRFQQLVERLRSETGIVASGVEAHA